jgi:hypothetical protein
MPTHVKHMTLFIPSSFRRSICRRKGRLMRALVATFALWASPAQAQSGATDNELYAAYCKGSLDFQIEVAGGPTSPPLLEQRRQEFLAPLLQQRQRFQAYLLSTGAITDSQRTESIFGLTAAIERGRSDIQRCIGAMTACQNAAQCSALHVPNPSDPLNLRGPTTAEMKCIGDRMSMCRDKEPSCARSRRCSGPDHLPF